MSACNPNESKDRVLIVTEISFRYKILVPCYNCLSCKTSIPRYVVLTSVRVIQHVISVRANSHIIMTHVSKL